MNPPIPQQRAVVLVVLLLLSSQLLPHAAALKLLFAPLAGNNSPALDLLGAAAHLRARCGVFVCLWRGSCRVCLWIGGSDGGDSRQGDGDDDDGDDGSITNTRTILPNNTATAAATTSPC